MPKSNPLRRTFPTTLLTGPLLAGLLLAAPPASAQTAETPAPEAGASAPAPAPAPTPPPMPPVARPQGIVFNGRLPSFVLEAPAAQAVELLVYADAAAAEPLGRRAMQALGDGAWLAPGDPGWIGLPYAYRIVRADGEAVVADPYAPAWASAERGLILDRADPALRPEGWPAERPAVAPGRRLGLVLPTNDRPFGTVDPVDPATAAGQGITHVVLGQAADAPADAAGIRARRAAIAALHGAGLLAVADLDLGRPGPAEILAPAEAAPAMRRRHMADAAAQAVATYRLDGIRLLNAGAEDAAAIRAALDRLTPAVDGVDGAGVVLLDAAAPAPLGAARLLSPGPLWFAADDPWLRSPQAEALLRTRAATPLLHLGDEGRGKVRRTEPAPGVALTAIDDTVGKPADPRTAAVFVVVNDGAAEAAVPLAEPRSRRRIALHPVLAEAGSAAAFDRRTGMATVPAGTAAVFVEPR